MYDSTDVIPVALLLLLVVVIAVVVVVALNQPSENCVEIGYDYGDAVECTKVCDDDRKISIPWSVILSYDPETVCELGY